MSTGCLCCAPSRWCCCCTAGIDRQTGRQTDRQDRQTDDTQCRKPCPYPISSLAWTLVPPSGCALTRILTCTLTCLSLRCCSRISWMSLLLLLLLLLLLPLLLQLLAVYSPSRVPAYRECLRLLCLHGIWIELCLIPSCQGIPPTSLSSRPRPLLPSHPPLFCGDVNQHPNHCRAPPKKNSPCRAEQLSRSLTYCIACLLSACCCCCCLSNTSGLQSHELSSGPGCEIV